MKKYTKWGLLLILAIVFAGCGKTVQVDEKTDNSLVKVKEKGVMTLGTYSDFSPMEFVDENGKIVGFDIDLMNAIVSEIGVSAELKEYAWEDIFEGVKSNEVDVIISGITITPERAEQMLFSVPYVNAGQSIIVKKGNSTIKGPEDLKDKKVAVLTGTTSEEAAHEYVDDASNVIGYSAYEEIRPDLTSGKVDVWINDLAAAVNNVKDNPGWEIVGEPFTQEFYGIATNLENQILMDEINRILRDMKRDGRLEDLEAKWLKK